MPTWKVYKRYSTHLPKIAIIYTLLKMSIRFKSSKEIQKSNRRFHMHYINNLWQRHKL